MQRQNKTIILFNQHSLRCNAPRCQEYPYLLLVIIYPSAVLMITCSFIHLTPFSHFTSPFICSQEYLGLSSLKFCLAKVLWLTLNICVTIWQHLTDSLAPSEPPHNGAQNKFLVVTLNPTTLTDCQHIGCYKNARKNGWPF